MPDPPARPLWSFLLPVDPQGETVAAGARAAVAAGLGMEPGDVVDVRGGRGNTVGDLSRRAVSRLVVLRPPRHRPPWRLVDLVRAYRSLAASGCRLGPGATAWVEVDVPAMVLPPFVARWALGRLGAGRCQVVWPRGGFAHPDLLLPIDDPRASHHYLHREFYAVGFRRRAGRALLLGLRRVGLLPLALPRYGLLVEGGA